jgi:hypothetical protein
LSTFVFVGSGNKENTKVRPEMTKFKMSRENKHGFLFCGNYILKYWLVIKTCYNSGQKERLCLIIDKKRNKINK